MITHDYIKAIFIKWNIMNVHFHICQGEFKSAVVYSNSFVFEKNKEYSGAMYKNFKLSEKRFVFSLIFSQSNGFPMTYYLVQ